MVNKKIIKNPQLKVEKRKLTGRKVRRLRRKGIFPANIYGKEIKSLSIQVGAKEAKQIFKEQGETGLIDLMVKGEKKARAVLIKNIQKNPVSDEIIHIDFHQVNLKEKVTANIPIEFKNESPAIKKGKGILVRARDEIEVEALPTDLPEKFIVDLSVLENVDDAVTVADLKIDGKKVELKVDPDQIIAKIEPPAKEEAVESPAEGAAEGEESGQEEDKGKAQEGKAEEKEEKKENSTQGSDASDKTTQKK